MIELKEKALNDLKDLSEEATEEVLDKLESFEKQQFRHPDLKKIRYDGREIWRLKIKEKDTDHRAFIDYIDGSFQVLQIIHRDKAYEN